MSKVDWSKAPDGAEFYGQELFWRIINKMHRYYCERSDAWFLPEHWHHPTKCKDYEWNPNHIVDTNEKVWPENDERVNIIGQNGNDGLVYQDVERCFNEQLAKQPVGIVGLSAATILQEGLSILSERGKQYGSEGEERSFPQVAQAFTALTGKQLAGSDVCLILALVKQVRQYAQPRYHHDSAVDGVNYLALQAEELQKERL